MAGHEEVPLLRVTDVWAGYGELDVLRGIDFTMKSGEIVCVIGANGAGKSTLLKTMFGQVPVRRGQISLDGTDVTTADSATRLRNGIVIVPQGRCNFPLMTVRENLEMGGYLRSRADVQAGIERAFRIFPVLEQKSEQLAGDMSGGEQQLLEIAMSLMLNPRLVLVDEPSLGLSHMMQRRVFETLQSLAKHDVGVLLVEQNAVQALQASNRGLVVERGRVAHEGSGASMLDDRYVRHAYLGLDA